MSEGIFFTDDDDRILFLEILGNMSERFEIEVYAYVLMNNHYHLLLKTKKPNISKGMQWFGTTYTRRYNIKHKRNGHLFQGRFKNFLVENDEYLRLLSFYIHRNPLRAGIVRRLVDYPWSSYPVYAYGKNHPSGYVQRLFFLILIPKIRTRHIEKWPKNIPGKRKEYGKIFGTVYFWDPRSLLTVSSPNMCPKILMPKSPKRQVLRDTNPKTILEKAAKVLQCNTNDFLQSARISDSDKLNRDVLIYLLWSTGWYNNQEIGDLFGLGYSSISRRVSIMKSKISKDDEIHKQLEEIKSLIKV